MAGGEGTEYDSVVKARAEQGELSVCLLISRVLHKNTPVALRRGGSYTRGGHTALGCKWRCCDGGGTHHSAMHVFAGAGGVRGGEHTTG